MEIEACAGGDSWGEAMFRLPPQLEFQRRWVEHAFARGGFRNVEIEMVIVEREKHLSTHGISNRPARGPARAGIVVWIRRDKTPSQSENRCRIGVARGGRER